jgi:hypothetical protein
MRFLAEFNSILRLLVSPLCNSAWSVFLNPLANRGFVFKKLHN